MTPRQTFLSMDKCTGNVLPFQIQLFTLHAVTRSNDRPRKRSTTHRNETHLTTVPMTDDALLHLVYAAALDVSLWPELLAVFSDRFGGAAAVLYDRGMADQRIELNASIGYSDAALTSFAAYFRHRDIRVRRALPLVTTGHVYLDDRDIAFADIERTEIQTDFYRPNDVGHVSGIVLTKQPTQFSVLSIHRSLRFGAFTTGEVALLDNIAPHMVRSWDISGRLRRVSDDARALMGALGALQAAVFLVDAAGTIHRMSPEAERVVGRGHCLRTRYNKLEATNPSDNAALKKLLFTSAIRPAIGITPDPTTITLRDSAGTSALTLLLAPAFPGIVSGEPLILVFANDPRASRPPDPLLIARQFGLTRAESRIVAALSDGLTVAGMAERFFVSQETVRTHLKHAMAKCDVRSQLDLVRLVLSSLGRVRHG